MTDLDNVPGLSSPAEHRNLAYFVELVQAGWRESWGSGSAATSAKWCACHLCDRLPPLDDQAVEGLVALVRVLRANYDRGVALIRPRSEETV